MGGKTVLGSVRSVRVAWPDYTQGEVMSQNRWSRQDRHFAGITRHCVLS